MAKYLKYNSYLSMTAYGEKCFNFPIIYRKNKLKPRLSRTDPLEGFTLLPEDDRDENG